MRAVGIKTLKDRLSEYLRLVAAGETVLVTDHDRVVAELGPPQAGRADYVSDALLADVVKRGWLTGRLYPRGSVPPTRPVGRLDEVLEGLARDRSDR
ncbi:MAG: type II toxin-antitoxin system Phd/YefM family antitoxin [Planctomycetes bacterium]|nr:type II toxin-antitoxin system Phd/YefM family antitoxin [Planctomycetota bacterium]